MVWAGEGAAASAGGAEDGLEKVLEVIVAAESRGDADPAADDGEEGEDHEGQEHDPGRLVDAVGVRGLCFVVLGFVVVDERD